MSLEYWVTCIYICIYYFFFLRRKKIYNYSLKFMHTEVFISLSFSSWPSLFIINFFFSLVIAINSFFQWVVIKIEVAGSCHLRCLEFINRTSAISGVEVNMVDVLYSNMKCFFWYAHGSCMFLTYSIVEFRIFLLFYYCLIEWNFRNIALKRLTHLKFWFWTMRLQNILIYLGFPFIVYFRNAANL